MNVHDLQQFLAGVAPLARAAGASEKAATELDRALQCLEPFKNRSLTDFTEFLRRADEYDRTGKLGAPPAKTRAAAKAGGLSVDDAAKIFNDLVARAASPTLTYADIDTAMKPIEKMLVGQLVELAAKLDIPAPKTPKSKIVDALKRRITELKANSERTQYRFGA
ncbi:MAG TPA: hypothetical protein VFE62_11235 [Gemmataceae bacterium]|nr:hypothetical protein [Gemmataceae bacterium]